MIRILFVRKLLWVALLTTLPLLTGCGVSGSALSTPVAQTTATSTPAPGSTPTQAGGELVQQETTKDYALTLRLGPVAQMLTPEQAKAATSGEVMISGDMTMSGTSGMAGGMTGMSGGAAPNHHIELAVADLKSGTVITDKSVSIDLTNTATNEKISVPIAVMYDVQVGTADTHFGNNVALSPGNYIVVVDVGGETATFNITASGAAGITILGGASISIRVPSTLLAGRLTWVSDRMYYMDEGESQ